MTTDQGPDPKQAPVARRPSARPCPICGKPATAEAQPFCSPRCGDIDLNRWLGGVYAVPSQDVVDPEEDSA